MFIYSWHNMKDITPDEEFVWFIYNGVILPGLYHPDTNEFEVADGDKVCGCKVYQWMCMVDKNVSGYPLECETVAVYIPQLKIPALGSFTGHYRDLETGNDIKAVYLNDIYEFKCTNDKAVSWERVFEWYQIPELPSKVVMDDCDYYKDMSIEESKTYRRKSKKLFIDEIDDKPEEIEKEEKPSVEKGKSALKSFSVKESLKRRKIYKRLNNRY